MKRAITCIGVLFFTCTSAVADDSGSDAWWFECALAQDIELPQALRSTAQHDTSARYSFFSASVFPGSAVLKSIALPSWTWWLTNRSMSALLIASRCR